MKFWTTLILIACLSLWRCSTVRAVRNHAAEQISQEMVQTGTMPTLRDVVSDGVCTVVVIE